MSPLDEVPVLGPSFMIILSKMTHFLSSFIDLPLKVSQPSHLLLFPLHLLVNDLMFLISWSNSSS
jgi:hypothetical protein